MPSKNGYGLGAMSQAIMGSAEGGMKKRGSKMKDNMFSKGKAVASKSKKFTDLLKKSN